MDAQSRFWARLLGQKASLIAPEVLPSEQKSGSQPGMPGNIKRQLPKPTATRHAPLASVGPMSPELDQVVTQRQLRCDVSQRISGGLGCQGTATGEPRVHLDDAEL